MWMPHLMSKATTCDCSLAMSSWPNALMGTGDMILLVSGSCKKGAEENLCRMSSPCSLLLGRAMTDPGELKASESFEALERHG